jgi:outer membrane receptor protein involved in Fe transport
MSSTNKLQNAVRFALGISAGTLAIGAAPGALAQDDAQEIEEITVTGSRIKRADLDSASPVSVLQREDILDAGLADVGNLIQRMPSMSGSPIGTTTNNGGDGSVQIDLRGLGVDRTLTLVNGKRVVDDGDYQTIPANMIERVEVLKDGASAVYGADAVAGVVNIITRKDFDGIEVNAQAADWFDTDAGMQVSIGLLAGVTFDRGNFLFGAEFVDQEEAYQADVPWQHFQSDYYIYPEGCDAQWFAPYDGTPSGGCEPIGSSRIPEGRFNFLGGDAYINPGQGLVADDDRLYNYAPVNYVQTPYKRTNIFAEANFDVSDNVRFTTEVRSNLRTSRQELAPMPYDSAPGFDPAYGGVFNGTPYNGISEDNYYLVQATAAAGLPAVPAERVRRRMVELTRAFDQDVTQWQANVALEGELNNISWDVYYLRGQRTRTDNDFGQFFGPNLANAMGPSADLDPDIPGPECYADVNDPSTLIAGCVPMNFFGGPNTVTQEMIDYVSAILVDTRNTRFESAGFGVSGDAFELPGGALGWAAGFGYLDEGFTYAPDSGKQFNEVTGSVATGTFGTLRSKAVYGEILAPLFDNGTQSLQLSAGVRWDDYNKFGDETTWQAGLELQAIDSLKLRATAGTVFRAPTVEDLWEGLTDDAPTYSDPCITGDTFTAGLVWTPEFGDGGLSATIDYWQVDIENAISSLGVQFILEDCYVRQVASSCAQITRTADYNIAEVVDTKLNVAEQGGKGIDTEVRYSLDTAMGQWDFAVLWAHTLERTKKANELAETVDLSGRYSDSTAEDGGAYAENKINYSVKWYRNNLMIGYLGEYVSDLLADTFCNCGDGNQPDGTYKHDVPSVLYHDLVARYEFGTGTIISAGLTNLTDEEPPIIETGFNAMTDPSTYRLFGRGWYLRVQQNF